MKISISFPPLESEKGTPLLTQNRQFQWFSSPTYIYPVVPATAATLLKKNGFDVFWDDGIAEELSYKEWENRILKENPDLLLIESKTPVIKKHWKIINKIKNQKSKIKIILVGDHVTALPKESFRNSKVDYVLTGGDYDFLLLNLVNHLEGGKDLEPGVWYREKDEIKNTGPFQLNHNLNELPFIDRNLTKWKLYAYKNGNFSRTPGTYIMSGRDCFWHKCTFCSWTTLYPNFQVRTPENVLDEIGELIEKYKVKEIMDDAGSITPGEWIRDFCGGMIKRGYNKKVKIDCNARFKSLPQNDYNLMAKAGFRLLLFGLESANQKTLDRVNKGIKVKDIIEGCKMAKKAGLSPHITTMTGYPWETKEEAQKTIDLAKELFRKGWVDTLQATIIIPYPGTPLYKYCKENNLLLTKNWDDFDMRKPVMKTEMSTAEIKELTRDLYTAFASPKFIMRKILGIRNFDDVKYIFRAGVKVISHLADFRKG